MPRYDDRDRYGGTRLYVGHLSSRTRSRDLEDIFSRYGRVQDVDMKRDYAFIEFRDPRDADDARYRLNGREFDGSRIIVEVAKGVPRGSGGSGGSREYLGRGPPPGSGRCFNCGLDGHWARDCKAGDWKNKCYRCGDRGHIERNCKNSPKKLRPGRSYSRSPTPRHGSHSRSYSRSRSPVKRSRSLERRSRSPRDSQSPSRRISSPPPSKRRNIRATPDERSPREKDSLSPRDRRSDYSASPKGRSCSPVNSADRDNGDERYSSPAEENGPSTSPSPTHKDDRSPNYVDDDGNNGSPGGLA